MMMNSSSPDMGERTFMATLLRITAFVFVIFIVSVTSCTMHADYHAAQALEKGADALGVACAISRDTSTACMLAAGRQTK